METRRQGNNWNGAGTDEGLNINYDDVESEPISENVDDENFCDHNPCPPDLWKDKFWGGK